MGMMFSWASPEYLLNKMTLEQIFMYYDHGLGILKGEPSGPNKDKPDLAGFNDAYGDKIKRPNSGGEQ
ncbi:MAG: hypothetical protein ACOCRU_03015 [bacterium]